MYYNDGMHVWELPGDRAGVIPSQHIRSAISAGVISGETPVPLGNVQPASLDLRLGDVAYRVRCSFLPNDSRVQDRVDTLTVNTLDLTSGAVLEVNRPYIIPLRERLALPEDVYGKASPKSSVGRVDVFTRVITDSGKRFDYVDSGYSGPLYLEIIPLSFAIRVTADMTMTQLRLFRGVPDLSDSEVAKLHEVSPLLYLDGEPLRLGEHNLSEGILASLDVSSEFVGYQARDNTPLLDMASGEQVAAEEFWDPVRSDNQHIILSPERLYLLMSREAIYVPPTHAAEMVAYDPSSGELRAHYAGFFDPGWGHSNNARGSRATLEVRAHDTAFMIGHGQTVCRFRFAQMLEEPDMLYGDGRSSYQHQRATLSKYFSGSDHLL